MKTSQFLYEDFVKLTLGVLRLAQWYFPALNFRVTNTSLYTDSTGKDSRVFIDTPIFGWYNCKGRMWDGEFPHKIGNCLKFAHRLNKYSYLLYLHLFNSSSFIFLCGFPNLPYQLLHPQKD